jgi:hypothetical protein
MKHQFKTEADLCAAFIEWVKPQGWTVYAETGGWDILLAHPSGEQVGIQAKLRFNVKVLAQAIPKRHSSEDGPDYRAVLVPEYDRAAEELCDCLGLIYFTASPRRTGQFRDELQYMRDDAGWNTEKRVQLPDYIPDVAAGASAPIQLTKWKISALRVCAVLELKGEITAADIRALGVDPRRWTNPLQHWLKPAHMRRGIYLRGDDLKFPEQHPTVYAQIRDEEAKRLESGGARVATQLTNKETR